MSKHQYLSSEKEADEKQYIASPVQAPLKIQSQSQQSITALHQSLGNYAVGRLLQAKLTVNQPGDEYEQEVDRVAEQIMRMPDILPAKEQCIRHVAL